MSDIAQDTPVQSNGQPEEQARQLSLGTAAARNLATTTKTRPQMQDISSRWLLRILPWVQVSGGVYRVNRRLSYAIGDGKLTFVNGGAQARVVPEELEELPLLRGLDDLEVMTALADKFVQREYAPGETIAEQGKPANAVLLIVHGKAKQMGEGEYDEPMVAEVLSDGDHFGSRTLLRANDKWEFTLQAMTPCTVLELPQAEIQKLADQSETLRAHLDYLRARVGEPQNRKGEAAIDIASGHSGEPELPGTYVEYEAAPREYELHVAQTVLRVHTRVADLYNEPMNQTEQQLRLTVEALRERQEREMVNNREIGLLNNADASQRISTRTGPPTPDDLDELLTRRRNTRFLLAHPRTIAAFGRECNRLGLYPPSVAYAESMVPAWRNVPLLPCNKIPISANGTSSIIAMRTGEEDQGVVGLHQTGIPDEYEPSLSIRFMGISERGIISYLVSAYYSLAVLVPDALGILEHCEIGR